MRGGHNVKPTNEHQKTGTFRPDRHGNRVDSQTPGIETKPPPPAHFDARHVSEWDKVCGHVVDMGVMAAPDVYLLEIYVSNWFIWQDAAMEVRQKGSTIQNDEGRTVKNPAVLVMAEAWKVLSVVSGLFGFSPRGRMGLKQIPKESGLQKQSDILNFVKAGALKPN